MEKKQKQIKKTTQKQTKKKKKHKKEVISAVLYDIHGKKKKNAILPKEVFSQKINKVLLSQAIYVYLSNQRQGGAFAKTRGEVRGSGRKIWRQKGTGRARHGDRYAGIFVGGGKAFGPRGRSFNKKLTKKMKRKAIEMALSYQYENSHVVVVDGIENIEPKTKVLVHLINNVFSETTKKRKITILIITDAHSTKVYQAGRNIPHLTIKKAEQVTTYDILSHKKLMISTKALEILKSLHERRKKI